MQPTAGPVLVTAVPVASTAAPMAQPLPVPQQQQTSQQFVFNIPTFGKQAAAQQPAQPQPPANYGQQAASKFKAVLHIHDPNNPNAEQKEPTLSEAFDERCGLSRTQRMIGFATCFSLGWLLNIMSLFAIGAIVTSPAKFAVMYTVGNVISLCSTGFLWGPMKALKAMFKPIRVGATVVFLASMAATLGCAFGIKPPQAWPVVICMLIQFCAAIWYTASCFPYGREILTRALGGCFRGLAGKGGG